MIRILVLVCLLFPFVASAGDAGVDAPAAEATVTVLPAADSGPAEAGSFVWKLYKAGHLVPAIIVCVFFLLTLLQKRIAWLRTGYRKVAVSSALAGLAMLAERVAGGTTPNLMMLMGAAGAAMTMYMQTQGEPKKA